MSKVIEHDESVFETTIGQIGLKTTKIEEYDIDELISIRTKAMLLQLKLDQMAAEVQRSDSTTAIRSTYGT